MVEITFTPEMRKVLAKMKGKTFKSYEGYFPGGWGTVIADAMRINLGSFAVDLKCFDREVENWREVDGYDPPTCLTCVESPIGEPLGYNAGRSTARLVGERITGIGIVSDRIESAGEPVAVIDVAIAISTKRAVYTFSRGVWFDRNIYPRAGGEIDIPYTVEECAEDWAGGTDEDEMPAQVRRTAITL